jgi:hypothetical protein
MENGKGPERRDNSAEDLSVQIRWPQSQGEPIPAPRSAAGSAVPTVPPANGQDLRRGADVRAVAEPLLGVLVAAASQIGAQLETLAAASAAFRSLVDQRMSEQEEDRVRQAASMIRPVEEQRIANDRLQRGLEQLLTNTRTLAERLDILRETQLRQTEYLDRVVTDQLEFAAQMRSAAVDLGDRLQALKRRIAVRGRADAGLDDVVIDAIADAVVARLDPQVRSESTRQP